MGTSAFEYLIAPVLWATLGSYIVGATVLALLNAIQALAGRTLGAARTAKGAPGAARDSLRRVDWPTVDGFGSIG